MGMNMNENLLVELFNRKRANAAVRRAVYALTKINSPVISADMVADRVRCAHYGLSRDDIKAMAHEYFRQRWGLGAKPRR